MRGKITSGVVNIGERVKEGAANEEWCQKGH